MSRSPRDLGYEPWRRNSQSAERVPCAAPPLARHARVRRNPETNESGVMQVEPTVRVGAVTVVPIAESLVDHAAGVD